MNGREGKMPDDRGIAPVEPGGVATREAALVGSRSGEGRWRRFARWCCRVGSAMYQALRAVVAWCLGTSSWEGRDRVDGGYWGGGAVTGASQRTPQADARRTAKEVRRLLDSLGSTPGDVAAYLCAAGVSGVPYDANRSPVGAYLSAVVGADPDVAAMTLRTDSVSLYLKGQATPTTVLFPGAVRDFAAAFNAGCYPILMNAAEEQRRPDR